MNVVGLQENWEQKRIMKNWFVKKKNSFVFIFRQFQFWNKQTQLEQI